MRALGETFECREVETLGEPWRILEGHWHPLGALGNCGSFGKLWILVNLGEPLGCLGKEEFQLDHGRTDGQTDRHTLGLVELCLCS